MTQYTKYMIKSIKVVYKITRVKQKHFSWTGKKMLKFQALIHSVYFTKAWLCVKNAFLHMAFPTFTLSLR